MSCEYSITMGERVEEQSSAFSLSLENRNGATDEQLVEVLVDGNRSAFAELVRRHSERFYGLAYRMIFNKNDAEDIVQECFVKLWKKPSMWKRGKNAKFTTWFYRVVSNACIDFNRKHGRVHHMEKEELIEDTHQGADENIYESQKEMMIQHAIQQLPEKQQRVLHFSYYEGLSNKETADILNTSVKAVESLLVRARKTLKNTLSGEVEQ